ncbi:alpha/beta hydrolase [Thiotrichales bacterium 19S3-7]|nr:alpha/beta hydrolase [Thiotrichales bacterium 19S3-7]MCF6802229.1 alpha/beta hydrolase [Thiotrichales bacterium 19S3-11]
MLNHKFKSLIAYSDNKEILPLEKMKPKHARFMSNSMIINGFPENINEKHYEIKIINKTLNNYNLRYYISENSKNDLIIFIHGGGFVIGDLNSYHHICLMLMEAASRDLVSIEYPLAPEIKYPIIHDVVLKTVNLIIEKSSEYENIILCGDSAGANIALYVASILKNKVKQLHMIYPWLDMSLTTNSYERLKNDGHLFLSESLLKWFREQYFNNDDFICDKSDYRYLNLDDIPATYVYACKYDRLYDDSINFYQYLKDITKNAELSVYDNFIHGALFYSKYVPEVMEIINDFEKYVNME